MNRDRDRASATSQQHAEMSLQRSLNKFYNRTSNLPDADQKSKEFYLNRPRRKWKRSWQLNQNLKFFSNVFWKGPKYIYKLQ